MFEALGVVINASCILILYLLMYTLFYKYNAFELKIGAFNDYVEINDARMKNLVDDINSNNEVIKNIMTGRGN